MNVKHKIEFIGKTIALGHVGSRLYIIYFYLRGTLLVFNIVFRPNSNLGSVERFQEDEMYQCLTA